MIRSKLTYANVVATLALVVAVAGGSTAIAISVKLKKNSVGTKQIKSGAITADKLAKGSVTASKLTGIRTVTQSSPALSPALAQCAANERLLSGGGGAAGSSLSDTRPSGVGTWLSNRVSGPGEAYALCLKSAPGAPDS